jgi:hypothetical protein
MCLAYWSQYISFPQTQARHSMGGRATGHTGSQIADLLNAAGNKAVLCRHGLGPIAAAALEHHRSRAQTYR